MIGLALLAGGLVIADDASAQPSIDAIQTYVWGDTDTSDRNNAPDDSLDSLEQLWVPTPHRHIDDRADYTNNDNITEVPQDGFLLVGVDYTASSASEITIRLIEDTTGDNPPEYDYDATIAADGTIDQPSEDDRNIWLADVDLPLQQPSLDTFSYKIGIDEASTGANGCGGTGDVSLRDGADSPCWFLIEIQNPESGSGPPTGDHFVEVEITDSDGTTDQQERMDDDGDDVDENDPERLLDLTDAVATIDSVSLTPTVSGASDTVQAGETLTVNVTASTSTTGTQRLPQWGDVDAWVCLFEDGENEEPYTQFADWMTPDGSEDGWDNPVACEFLDYPTHDGNGDANAINVLQDDPNKGDSDRFFEASVEFGTDELEQTGSSFIDDFNARVMLRDPIGNIIVDGPGSSSLGTVTVAKFDAEQNVDEIEVQPDGDDPNADEDVPTVTQFSDNDGCFYEGEAQDQDSGFTPSEDSPCFIGRDFAPPSQTFAFPITIENYGNVEDEVLVDLGDRPDKAGSTDWTVEFVGDSTSKDSITVTVPAATPTQGGNVDRSTVEPGETTIEVRITPKSTSLAGPQDPTTALPADLSHGFRTIRLDAESTLDASSSPIPRFLQAQLVENAQGRLLLGDDETNLVTVDAQTDQTSDVTVTVENTGNTNGPFNFRTVDSPSECAAVGSPNDESKIELDFVETLPKTVQPSKERTFTLEVTPGENVPIGSYDCELDFQGSGPTLLTSDPTVRVSVSGTPDIRIWDVRGPDREEVNITGENLTIPVPPDQRTENVTLYLENVGDVALEPLLISEENGNFLQRDKFGLAGEWVGVNHTDGPASELSIRTAGAPFNLPVSDANDSSEVKIRELFPNGPDGTQNNPAGVDDSAPWLCAGEDAQEDSDTDPRAVCQLHFRYDFSDRTAVTGDLVVAKFKYRDSGGEGDPSQVNIRLDFGHIGTVEATSVPDKVLQAGQSTTPVFQATLDEPYRFDLDASGIDARLEASFDGKKCTGDASHVSSSEGLRSATFRPGITVDDTGSDPCTVSNSGIEVSGSGPLELTLHVEDENGTQIRQIHPVTLEIQADPPGSTAQPSSFSIAPAQEIDADGTQFARLSFDAGSDGDGFPNEAGEGLLLTRKSAPTGLEPFTSCSLSGDAVSVSGSSSPLAWTVLPPDPEDDEIEYIPDEESDRRNVVEASWTNVTGLILDNRQRTDRDKAATVGGITLWGWDSTNEPENLTWREGWNPFVLRVTDDDGDPARGPDASNGVSLDLELRFVAHDSSGRISDAYELSTEDQTIRTRALGNGFFAADIYIPAGDTDNPGPADALRLGDYNSTQDVNTQSVYREAFALHAEITSGESTSGEDLSGDAYWQLDDLGLIQDPDGADGDHGTVGTPQIEPGLIGTRSTLTEPEGSDDTGEYLHAAPHFLDPLMSARSSGSSWVTGPGVQDYGVFVMEERADPQDDDRRFNGSDAITDDYRDHTFSPATNADLRLTVRGGGDRFDVPAATNYNLGPVSDDDGLYSAFVVLPDTGRETFEWRTDLDITTDDGTGDLSFFQIINTRETLEPSANGLPMPLCLREPANAFDESAPAGDFDDADIGNRQLVDLRTVPGLLVDRGGFAMVPLIENGDGGIEFEVNPDGTFHVVGESLLSLSASQLPTSGETGRDIPITVTPTPTSAVSEVTATLRLNGTTEDTATLVGPDADGDWSGSVIPPEAGSYTLRVSATDTGGGVEVVSSTVEVQANSPPSITIVDPAEVEGERAMPSDGEIEATIADNLISADAITLEEKVGSSDGQQGTVLSNSDVTFDSLTDEPTVGDHSVMVTFSDVEAGTAYVNVTDMPGENMTASISGNESSGTIRFNETGAATVTVQTNGTDGVDTSFDVQVQSTGDDGFSEVDLGSDAISCEGTTCTLTYSPSGLSDGDTYTFKIVANISEDDKNTRGPVEVTVDDESPSVSISIGTPQAGGSPTRVGTGTSVTVEAEDNVMIESILLGARKGGVETGTQSFEGEQASVTGEVSSLSQLGLDSSGTAVLNATVTDIAGNEDTARVEVQIDGEGPSLSDAALEAQGAGLRATLTVSDRAGVDEVQLLVKKPGETTFSGSTMQQASGGEYTGSVSSPGNSGTLEYYFRATDDLGNERTLGSESNPRTFDLSSVSLENAPPEVSVISPGQDERVSGTFDLTLELSDPDAGDTVEVDSVLLTPSSGNEVSVDLPSDLPGDGETTIPVNTTDVAEGRTIIEIEVSDGTDTSTAQRTVFVDNLLDPCEDSPALSGGEVTFCLTFTPAGNVTDVQMELVRNGETVATGPADCDGSVCRASFPEADIPTDAPLRPDLVVTTDDGQTQRHQGEIQSLGSALSPDEPLGRFVTTLVLGVATMGAAAYGGFRRWG